MLIALIKHLTSATLKGSTNVDTDHDSSSNNEANQHRYNKLKTSSSYDKDNTQQKKDKRKISNSGQHNYENEYSKEGTNDDKVLWLS